MFVVTINILSRSQTCLKKNKKSTRRVRQAHSCWEKDDGRFHREVKVFPLASYLIPSLPHLFYDRGISRRRRENSSGTRNWCVLESSRKGERRKQFAKRGERW